LSACAIPGQLNERVIIIHNDPSIKNISSTYSFCKIIYRLFENVSALDIPF
jgi:hypothetical protein